MNRTAAVTRIQRILGFRSDKATEIIDALQDAQVELENAVALPRFLISTISESTTVDTEEALAVPGTFLREYEPDALFYFDSTADDEDKWTELGKDDVDFLRDALPGSGSPKAYALVNECFFIFPTPDDAYTLKLIYYKQDTVLSSDIENNWLKYAHDVMIGVAGAKLAGPMRDASALGIFQEMEKNGRLRLFLSGEAREHENRRYVMGGSN